MPSTKANMPYTKANMPTETLRQTTGLKSHDTQVVLVLTELEANSKKDPCQLCALAPQNHRCSLANFALDCGNSKAYWKLV